MTVSRNIVGLIAATAFMGAATTAFAAGSVVQTASVTAGVNTAISVTNTQALVFGTIIKPGNGDTNTVTVSNAGVRSVSGAGDASLGAGSPTAATFSLVAPSGTTYTTTQSLSLTPVGLANATANAPTAATGTLGTVPVGGSQDLSLGGSFDVSASTPTQAYTGTLTLTVNYD